MAWQRDDTAAVTVVIAMQVMVAGLATGLLLGRRTHRNEQAHTLPRNDECPSIEFHPELMVRWDNEADYSLSATIALPLASRLASPIGVRSPRSLWSTSRSVLDLPKMKWRRQLSADARHGEEQHRRRRGT